jgi:nitrogen regulatory protein PII-like uncharacterized protein
MSKTVVYNKSKTYLLPLLSELIEFDFKFIDYLENTFMYEDSGKYKDHFFILHNYAFTDPEFSRYESKLTDNELFVEYIDVGNKVLYIYKFPEEYLHEYNCLAKGRYSAFGVDAKEKILEFWTAAFKNVNTAILVLLKIKQILFKDKKLKQQIEKELSSEKHKIILADAAELGSIPDEESETFELSPYLKK